MTVRQAIRRVLDRIFQRDAKVRYAREEFERALRESVENWEPPTWAVEELERRKSESAQQEELSQKK